MPTDKQRQKRRGGARPTPAPKTAQASDAHGHYDVAVLVVLAVGGTELSGRLRIFEFQFYVAGADCLQEIQDVLRIEANRKRVALVAGLDRVFRFSGF